MQLSKILLENSAMLPPDFDDIESWVKLRKYVNEKFHLKEKVKHWGYELIVSIIVILSSVNAAFVLFDESRFVDLIDNFFIWLFFVELCIRILALGPENFFADPWNVADTCLVSVGIFFFIFGHTNGEGLVRIFRFIRISSLLKLMAFKFFPKIASGLEIYGKIKNLFTIIL
jgi:hypothetical protein